MANNPRTLKSVLFGIWVRLLSLIIPLTFPAHFTTLLFRLMGVKVGKGSKISRSATLDSSYPHLMEIGKRVWVTQKVMILCHERDLIHHGINKAVMDSPLKTKKVCISDGAHLGIGAIIMPGVTIGEGAVIGAGAVVTKSIPPYCVAVGVPAKVIKYFDKDEGHI